SLDDHVARHCRMVPSCACVRGNRVHDACAAPSARTAQASLASGGCLMFQQALHLAVVGLAIVATLMFILWITHLLMRNAAIADAGWAAGLAILGIFYASVGPGYGPRKWAIATMAGFWGLRLAVYLLFSR